MWLHILSLSTMYSHSDWLLLCTLPFAGFENQLQKSWYFNGSPLMVMCFIVRFSCSINSIHLINIHCLCAYNGAVIYYKDFAWWYNFFTATIETILVTFILNVTPAHAVTLYIQMYTGLLTLYNKLHKHNNNYNYKHNNNNNFIFYNFRVSYRIFC